MFAITKNSVLNISHFRTGMKQDKTPYTLLTAIEKFNQPDGVENNSSSTVKMWDAEISGTPADGCQVVLEDFIGINWKHENRTYNGKKSYFDTVEIVGAKVRVLD